MLAVADGQCAIIVEQGKVADLRAEPGKYVYNSTTEPSVFSGDLSSGIQSVFAAIGKRFAFGGEAPHDQRIYYINSRELPGNLFGTPSPIPFRIVDRNIGLDVDTALRCNGEYTIRITNPILFYTNVCGNVEQAYPRENLESQMKAELLTALQPALAKISEMGIRYSAIPARTKELAQALNEELSAEWRDRRGMEIISMAIRSMTISPEDEALIKELQRNATLKDPTMAAAANPGGAAMGFVGMGMAQQTGGINASQLFQMGAQQPAQPQQAPAGLTYPHCGAQGLTGKFCPECGHPLAPDAWTCPKCGKAGNEGKFCSECGAPRA